MTEGTEPTSAGEATAGDAQTPAESSEGGTHRTASKLYSFGGLALLAAAVLLSGEWPSCDDDDGGPDPDPPPATTAPPPVTTAAPTPVTTQAPQQQQCFIFCSDFEVENQDGSTTVYDHDTGTMVTTQPDGGTVTTNVHTGVQTTVDPDQGTTTVHDPHTGETTTTPTSQMAADQEDIEQQFMSYDGQNGRDGQAGLNAMNDYIETYGYTDDGGTPRHAVNYGHCVSFFGESACDIDDPDQVRDLMCGEGVSYGRTGTCTDEDFDGGAETTNYHNDIWFDRCPNSICGEGYRPPGGHSGGDDDDDGGGGGYIGGGYSGGGNTCSGGLTVNSAYIDTTTGDNGCRPPHCDFGRDADGWCLPPASNDPPVVYVLSPLPVTEDAGSARFAVALTHAYTQDVTVDVETSDGTATEGDDYQAVSQQVTVPAHNTVAYVAVPLVDDATHETAEDFTLTLSNVSSNADLSQTPTADATINDNDPAPAGDPVDLGDAVGDRGRHHDVRCHPRCGAGG